MSTKFGLHIDFDFLKAVISTNVKPEIVLASEAAILIKRYDVIFPHWLLRFGQNSAG